MDLLDVAYHLKGARAATPQGQLILDRLAHFFQLEGEEECRCGACPGFMVWKTWDWLTATPTEETQSLEHAAVKP